MKETEYTEGPKATKNFERKVRALRRFSETRENSILEWGYHISKGHATCRSPHALLREVTPTQGLRFSPFPPVHFIPFFKGLGLISDTTDRLCG